MNPIPTLVALAQRGIPLTRAAVWDRAPDLVVSVHLLAHAEAARLAAVEATRGWAVPPYDRGLLELPDIDPTCEPVVLAVLARSCAYGSERDHAAWRLERLDRLAGRPTRIVEIAGDPVRVLDTPKLPAPPEAAPLPAVSPSPFSAAWIALSSTH